ncbi:enoyl-CoA hydratase/isomerase family protein [Thermodesulfobacteriota bacterium]
MSKKEWDTVYLEAKGRVAWIYLNRPEAMNATSVQLINDLDAAFRHVEKSDDYDVVVLTGVGEKAFCGGDLKMILDQTRAPEEAYRMLSDMMRLVWSIKSMSKPVIARVNGLAIGGAGELLMPCDIIIAAEHAKFMLGETTAGAVPFVGTTQWLGLAVGDKRAKYALLTDEMFSAQTALEWGLVNKVVPMDKLDEEVDKVATKLANKAPWAIRLIKTQANTLQDLTTNSLMAGRDSWTLLTLVPDLMKSCQAFMEKKAPDWAGWRAENLENNTSYYYWGPLTKSCDQCGEKNLPENMKYCGACGNKM